MSPVHPATDDGSRPSPVTVQILDKDYRIACSDEEQHALMDCARLLDRRMREVRQNGRVIGADRIAVMAALNLIYELMQQRSEVAGPTVPLDRLAALQQRVDAALNPTADAAPGRTPPDTPAKTATFEPVAEAPAPDAPNAPMPDSPMSESPMPDSPIPESGDAAPGDQVAQGARTM